MAIGLTVEFTVAEGKAEAFEAFMAGATAKVKAEEDLTAHGTSEAMQGMAGIREFTTARPVLHRYDVPD